MYYGLGKLGMAAIFIFTLISCASPEDPNCGMNRTLFNQNIKWRYGLPITMTVPQQYLTPAQNAANIWNNAANRSLITIQPGDTYYPVARDGFMGIYFGADLPGQTLGMTSAYSFGNTIIEADIQIKNEIYYWGIPSTLAPNGAVNLEALLLHEMGHVLGLVHRTDSVMNPRLHSNSDKIILTDDDKFAIVCAYEK